MEPINLNAPEMEGLVMHARMILFDAARVASGKWVEVVHYCPQRGRQTTIVPTRVAAYLCRALGEQQALAECGEVEFKGKGGKRVELRPNIWLAPAEWSDARKKVLGTSQAARTANATITKLAADLTDLHADLERQGKPVTANALARGYKADGAVLDMVALCEAFLAEREGLIGIEIAETSHEVAKTRHRLLLDFLHAHKLAELRPEEFTHNLADKLLHWCIKERGHARSYANKAVQGVSQVLRWGVRREYLSKNPLSLYQVKGAAQVEIKHLGEGELVRLSTSPLPVPCLERVRDCFVFQCWTGLAYADVKALNVSAVAEYHKQQSGAILRVLRVRRAKSTLTHGFECVIPLLPEAERILAKYGDTLPVPTNQIYNRYLKQVGELCGIEAGKMTSHVGRKTAGTLLFNRGVPLPVVSKILGHANTLITQQLYAKLLDTTVVDAFSGLFGAGLAAKLPTPPIELLPAPGASYGAQKGGAAL